MEEKTKNKVVNYVNCYLVFLAENMLNILNSYYVSNELYQKAFELDRNLRYNYPAIDNLQSTANCLGQMSQNINNSCLNKEDDIQHRLRMDIRGIEATVLLKHQVVDELRNVLEDIN